MQYSINSTKWFFYRLHDEYGRTGSVFWKRRAEHLLNDERNGCKWVVRIGRWLHDYRSFAELEDARVFLVILAQLVKRRKKCRLSK